MNDFKHLRGDLFEATTSLMLEQRKKNSLPPVTETEFLSNSV